MRRTTFSLCLVSLVLSVPGCGDDSGSDGGDDAGTAGSGGDGGGSPSDCYAVGSDGVLVLEGENLPLNDMWTVGSSEAGFTGTGYAYWSGESFNGQPGNGEMLVDLQLPEAGRYKFQWRARIGMGDDPTEHNDVWVKFPDAVDYYGMKDSPESRRYPKPQCEDADFIAGIEGLPETGEIRCAEGSTRDGWMKVYSSGARDWRWSTQTSDNDAHPIFFEVDAAGTYTLQMSARADWMLIDRIVVHLETVDDDTARDESRAETRCE